MSQQAAGLSVHKWARRAFYLFLIARLGLVGLTLRDPTGGVLVDSEDYIFLANQLSQGSYQDPSGGNRDLTRPPGYPLFLATTFVPTGATWVPVLLQLAATSLLAFLVFRACAAQFSPSAGLVAGWLIALSPNLMLWSATIMTEALFALLIASAALLLWAPASARPGGGKVMGAAILLAGAIYLRPVGIVLAPTWLVLMIALKPSSAANNGGKRAVVGFAAIVALLVIPWYLRNLATHGQFSFSNVGYKTMTGFNLAEAIADAEGLSRNDAVQLLPAAEGLVPLTLEVASRYPVSFAKVQILGVLRTLAGTDIGTWGIIMGWDSWKGLGLLSGLFGGGDIFGDSPLAGNRGALETTLHRAILGLSLAYSLVLLVAAGAASLLALRSRVAQPFFWFVLVTAALLIVGPGAAGQARFRVPAEPFLALAAALALWPRKSAGLGAKNGVDAPGTNKAGMD